MARPIRFQYPGAICHVMATCVGNGWMAARLAMGHPGSVSRMHGSCRSDIEIAALKNSLAKGLDIAGSGGNK